MQVCAGTSHGALSGWSLQDDPAAQANDPGVPQPSLDCSAPKILYQIPTSQCRAGADHCKRVLKLTSAGMKALKAAEGVDSKMETIEDAREERTFYTADMFGPSATGDLAIKAYMAEMKRMYEKTFGQALADAQGRATAMRISSFPVAGVWDEMVQRSPPYFEVLRSTKDLHGKTVVGLLQHASLQNFSEVAPTQLRGTQAFLTCLRKVDKAPAALPTA